VAPSLPGPSAGAAHAQRPQKDGKACTSTPREGIEVEREPRAVTFMTEMMALAPGNAQVPAIEMIVKCSKGTYIRTLGEDIGEALGCGAHLSALRRMARATLTWRNASRWRRWKPWAKPSAGLPAAGGSPAGRPHARHAGRDNAGGFLSGLRRRGTGRMPMQVAVYASTTRALLGTAHVQAVN
jgi:tRNA pseudouridine55 synthase